MKKGSKGIMKKIATEIETLFEMLEEGESPRVGNALTRIAEYKLGRRKANYKVQDRIKDSSKVTDWIIQQTDHPDTDWLWEILNEGYSDEPRKLYDMFYDYIVSRKMELLEERLESYDGVILFSGGLDSVALGMVLAQDKKKKYLPIYISHRSNVGNVTKKEIVAARKLAKKIFGEELMVIKPHAKGKLPDWYGKRVYVTEFMPVPKTKKNERNRRFLKVLNEYGLADKEIWLGVLGPDASGDRGQRVRTAGRSQDVTKEGLQKHLKEIGGKGKIKVVRDIKGVKTKADLLRKLPKNFRPDIIESQSCLMYFNKPCGDCWSCMERVESIMQVYGKDQTPYRKDSKADKYKKKTAGVRTTSILKPKKVTPKFRKSGDIWFYPEPRACKKGENTYFINKLITPHTGEPIGEKPYVVRRRKGLESHPSIIGHFKLLREAKEHVLKLEKKK